MRNFKSLVISVGLFCSALGASAQTYQPFNLSSNTIPQYATNAVASTAVQNGYIKTADLYYSFLGLSTNGNVVFPIQSSPDGLGNWQQVSTPYLRAGTTNQINVALSTVTPQSNVYSGMVTVDLSHGQFFRVGEERNSGTNSWNSTFGVTNLLINYLLPQN